MFDGIDERLERWIAASDAGFDEVLCSCGFDMGDVTVLLDYQREKNAVSIDGLAAVDLPLPVAE